MAQYSVNNYTVENLLGFIKAGDIAIPEIQRPFVWDGSKVRDLLDSLYQGYPIGYIIVWQNPDVKLKDGTVSTGKKVLIDGQQRIMSLSAASKSNYGAGCTYSRRYYKNMGRLFDSPKPGDQIFFFSGGDIGNTNQIAHTGIVESVDKTYVYTIEGNTSNKVARRKYKLTDSKIAGYGRPNWECDGVPAETPKTETPAATVTERKATTTAEPAKIWNYLMKEIGNAYGVAGLMGNLKSESALKSINLQNTYEKKLGYTDAEYTAAVDSGKYTKFGSDSAGYGLAQWTSSGRKKNLLAYAQEKKSSIGNLETQLEFLMKELRGSYKSTLSVLKAAKSVREASDAVLTKFERPANQGEAVKLKRASYGEAYYKEYAGKETEPEAPEVLKKGDKGEAVAELQRMLIETGRTLPKWGVDGDFGKETEDALKAFQEIAGVPVNGIYDEITRAALEAKAGIRVAVVTGGAVNTRFAPNTDGKIYKVVKRGARLPFVRTDDATGWHLVMVDGVMVWISNKFTKVEAA